MTEKRVGLDWVRYDKGGMIIFIYENPRAVNTNIEIRVVRQNGNWMYQGAVMVGTREAKSEFTADYGAVEEFLIAFAKKGADGKSRSGRFSRISNPNKGHPYYLPMRRELEAVLNEI
jgi:hypothetical protein